MDRAPNSPRRPGEYDPAFDGVAENRPRKRLPCRNLRTKTCYTAPVGEDPEYDGHTQTAAYWCLLTMRPVGPDEDVADPDACGVDRPCCDPVRDAGRIEA